MLEYIFYFIMVVDVINIKSFFNNYFIILLLYINLTLNFLLLLL